MTRSNVIDRSWRELPAAQQPVWPDRTALEKAADTLRGRLPLVSGLECLALRGRLGSVAHGEAFILHGGDCAEPFWEPAKSVRAKIKVFLQMNLILMYGASLPVVKIGRIAGQYPKPRSSETETRDGVTLPSYRGPIVNRPEFTVEARTPDPALLLDAYQCSAATLNLIRTLMQGGFASLRQLHAWNAEFVRDSPQGMRYEQIAFEIDRALNFMEACGVDLEHNPVLKEADFYVSHEGLLLDYEEPFVRLDRDTDQVFDLSTHMLWIGDRTRQIDHGHVAFCASIANPIGLKVGPSMRSGELATLINALNPDNIPGRLTLISRMGADLVAEKLPPLLRAARSTGKIVAWECDPMHGNGEGLNGFKTRRFGRILREIEGFFAACRVEGVWPGGLHLELTGDNVTECLGGSAEVGVDDLSTNYTSLCDPRLNAQQALDVAFLAAELLRHV